MFLTLLFSIKLLTISAINKDENPIKEPFQPDKDANQV